MRRRPQTLGVALVNLYGPSVRFLTYASSFATEPTDAPNAGCGIRRGRIVLGDLLLSASGPRSTSLARAGRLRLGNGAFAAVSCNARECGEGHSQAWGRDATGYEWVSGVAVEKLPDSVPELSVRPRPRPSAT
jgi:hypothetical protein